jgi:hypothetical protein
MIEISNMTALAGSWSGFIYDSTTQVSRPVQLGVSSTDIITSASGISLIAGKIYEELDTFAAYITTTDANCAYQYIQLSGLYLGDSLSGKADLGQHNDSNSLCNHSGYVYLTKTPAGIITVKSENNFSAYPNPFSGHIEIAMKSPAAKTQADLFDMLGNKVYTGNWNNAQNVSLINLDMLNSGVYLLSVTIDGKIITRRVIKNQ